MKNELRTKCAVEFMNWLAENYEIENLKLDKVFNNIVVTFKERETNTEFIIDVINDFGAYNFIFTVDGYTFERNDFRSNDKVSLLNKMKEFFEEAISYKNIVNKEREKLKNEVKDH